VILRAIIMETEDGRLQCSVAFKYKCTVKNCMKKVLVLVIVIIAVVSVQAYTLADYPKFFVEGDRFRAIYVIGEEAPALDVVSATVLSTALVKYPNVTTEIGTSRIDTEIADIRTKNAIVIGSPCENRAAAQLEGNPQPCNKNLGGGAGYIKLFEQNGRVQLLITGLSAEDRHQAARFLAERSLSRLNVSSYIISTSTNSTPQFFTRNSTNQAKNNTTTRAAILPQVNTSVVLAQPSTPVVEAAPPPPVVIGEYEPLRELPAKKGFFSRLWAWLKNVF